MHPLFDYRILTFLCMYRATERSGSRYKAIWNPMQSRGPHPSGRLRIDTTSQCSKTTHSMMRAMLDSHLYLAHAKSDLIPYPPVSHRLCRDSCHCAGSYHMAWTLSAIQQAASAPACGVQHCRGHGSCHARSGSGRGAMVPLR